MRNIVDTVKIDEVSMAYLEKLSYDVEGYKVLISNINNLTDISKEEIFSELLDRYESKSCERKVLLNTIVGEYCEEYLLKSNLLFIPNFHRGEIEIYEQR